MTNSKNRGLVQVAETAPADWPRVEIGEKVNGPAIYLCEERTFRLVPNFRENRIIAFDSVRQKPGFFKQFRCAVFTLDAPAEGATWLWTPIAEKYYKKPEPKTNDVIFIGRTNYRQEECRELEKLGVKIIPRDENRSYQEYANELKRARAVVNLCKDRVTGKAQLKGRVIETMFADTRLFEQANLLTPQKVFHYDNYWETFEQLHGLIVNRNYDYGFPGIRAAYAQDNFSSAKFWQIVAS